MPRQKLSSFTKIAIIAIFSLGLFLLVLSAFYVSSFLAIFGTALLFWVVILLYITPVKHVPLALLNASANLNESNIERALTEFNLTENGIYLPPKNLGKEVSSLVFVPRTRQIALPNPEENTEKLSLESGNGIFITPPGLALSQFFEKEIGDSFTKIDPVELRKILPKLLVEVLEIAEDIEVKMEENRIIVEVTGSLFNSLCSETDSQPRTHAQVGCLLSSALACVLAKATGKPITIQKETQTPETKTTTIEYRIEEG